MYEVIKGFMDLQDDNHLYEVGQTYPRSGYKPTDERIAELSGSNNKRGKPLLKARQNAAESVTEGKPKRGRRKA